MIFYQNVKFINKIMTFEHKMESVNYSEKSIAVIGDTREHKDNLKRLGGKFNMNLTITGEKQPGWVFPKTQQSVVDNFLSTGEVQETQSRMFVNTNKDTVSKKEFDDLVRRLELLEQKVKDVKSPVIGRHEVGGKIVGMVHANGHVTTATEEDKPKTRLLRKK